MAFNNLADNYFDECNQNSLELLCMPLNTTFYWIIRPTEALDGSLPNFSVTLIQPGPYCVSTVNKLIFRFTFQFYFHIGCYNARPDLYSFYSRCALFTNDVDEHGTSATSLCVCSAISVA